MVYETLLQHIIRYHFFWHDTFASRGWSTADFSTGSSGRNENLATMTTLDSSRLQSFIEVMWLGRHGKGTTGSRLGHAVSAFAFCGLNRCKMQPWKIRIYLVVIVYSNNVSIIYIYNQL